MTDNFEAVIANYSIALLMMVSDCRLHFRFAGFACQSRNSDMLTESGFLVSASFADINSLAGVAYLSGSSSKNDSHFGSFSSWLLWCRPQKRKDNLIGFSWIISSYQLFKKNRNCLIDES